MFKVRIVFLGLLLLASLSHARPPASVIERNWLQEDGMPSNIVSRIVQDQRGFLWLATAGGLARFDGSLFKVYPFADATYRQSIREMSLAPDGSLIILPRTGGIYAFKEGFFSVHPASAQLADETLTSVHIEPGGVIWFVGRHLYRWERGSLQSFKPDVRIRSLTTDKAGVTWMALGEKVFYYRGGKLVPLAGEFGAFPCLVASRESGVWICTGDSLVLAHEGRAEVVSSGSDWRAIGDVISFVEDERGNLWIATRVHGVFRFSSEGLLPVSTSHQRILSFYEDEEDNIWLASDGGGLIRLRAKVFVGLNSSTGLQVDISTSVCEDLNGGIWVANREGGLARWDGERLTQVFQADDGHNKFFTLCVDKQNRLWGSTAEGLFRFPVENPDKIERVAQVSGPIYALYCARNDDVWVSSEGDGLGFFRDDRFHSLAGVAGAPSQRVVAFAEGVDGRFWVASNPASVAEYKSGYFVDQAFPISTQIHSLYQDAKGTLWIGTRHGLVCKRDAHYRTITSAEGLPDDVVMQILPDDFGRLWFGSLHGIFNVTVQSLYEVIEGRRDRLASATYGRNEGLLGASAFFRGPPTAARGADGTLWFVTHRGVVGMDSAGAPSRSDPPPVYIDSVLVDDRPQAVGSAALHIAPGSNKIEFRFVGLNYSAPEKLKFRYRLIGLDREWNNSSSERSASYAHLPPGRYTMHVTAGTDERWNEVGASLEFVVLASWWQTWVFRASLIVMALVGVFLAVRFWSHRRLHLRLDKLERAHALELERARIARNLHDDLGGSLIQIRLMAERLKREARESPLEESLSALGERTRQISASLEGLVWTINPKNSTWGALMAFLVKYSERVLRESGIAHRIASPDSPAEEPVSPEVQHHILSVVKESISNILKHAGASHVTIKIEVVDGIFVFDIDDNGAGFEQHPSGCPDGNGLRNMQSRAAEMGASIQLSSQPGRGTHLRMRVSINARVRVAGASPPGAVHS